MGAWGYGAAENDTASDWLYKNLLPQLRRTIDDPEAFSEETLVALVVILDLDLRTAFDGGDLWEAFDRVVAEDATLDWRSAPHRKRYINRVRAVLGGKSPGPIGLNASARPPER